MQSDSAVFQLVTNALQASDLRQQIYANNIANMETPGYKREDVQFEAVLQNAMGAGQSASAFGEKQIPISGTAGVEPNWSAAVTVQPTVVQSGGGMVDNNGNNVDVDAEMADLAENQIRYETLVQDLQSRMTRMKTAYGG